MCCEYRSCHLITASDVPHRVREERWYDEVTRWSHLGVVVECALLNSGIPSKPVRPLRGVPSNTGRMGGKHLR